jgi:predicted Co/Zn/Cd cation transporter (cation efflux family)
VFGILAVLAFALAFLFHGFRFAGNSWVDPASLAYLGLTFLALHLLGVGVAVVERIRPARSG